MMNRMRKGLKLACIAMISVVAVAAVRAQTALDPVKDKAVGDDFSKQADEKNTAVENALKAADKKAAETAASNNNATERTDNGTKGGKTEDKGPGTIFTDGKVTYASCNTRFQLDSADTLSQLSYIEYRVDDSPLKKYTEPFNIEEEGTHRITYRGVDKVGNVEPQSMLEVIVDCTPPNLTSVTNPTVFEKDGIAYLPATATIEFKAVDKYSGVDKINYQFDGGNMAEATAPVQFDKSGKTEGPVTVTFKAADKLGNMTENKTFKVSIDGKPPTVEIVPQINLIEFGGKKYSLRSNFFSVNAVDPDSGISKILVKTDGQGDFQPYTTPLNFTVEGLHSIEAKAVDNAGNESAIVKSEFLVDDNPPRTSIKPINVKVIENKSSTSTNTQMNEETNSTEQENNNNTEENTQQNP